MITSSQQGQAKKKTSQGLEINTFEINLTTLSRIYEIISNVFLSGIKTVPLTNVGIHRK